MNNLPTLDVSLTITGIIAVSAIFSPIFVAIINNRYQFKLKKLELEQKQYEDRIKSIKQVYFNYVKYTGRCLASTTYEKMSDYYESYFQLLMYVPDEIASSMKTVNSLITEHQLFEASNEFEKITPKLKKDLQRW